MRRIHGHHLSGDQPVEEHAHRGEVLLDARLGVRLLKLLDVGRDDGRADVRKITDTVLSAPTEEIGNGASVGSARVRVPDVRRDELVEAPTVRSPAPAMSVGTWSRPA
jgi:hypothetical protein